MDDGPEDMATAIEMARITWADGITVAVCTPHINAGLYDNGASQIRAAVWHLSDALRGAGLPLHLAAGADVHPTRTLREGRQGENTRTLGKGDKFRTERRSSAGLVGNLSLAEDLKSRTPPERLLHSASRETRSFYNSEDLHSAVRATRRSRSAA